VSEYTKPLPVINEDNAEYWAYCKKHELRMQKCSNCGHVRFPCAFICPRCHNMEFEWHKMSGKGEIYSFVVFQRAYDPSYKDDLPYVVAIVKLDEGLRMESNITDCKPEEVKVDLPVELYFDDVTPEWSLPKFRLAKQ